MYLLEFILNKFEMSNQKMMNMKNCSGEYLLDVGSESTMLK